MKSITKTVCNVAGFSRRAWREIYAQTIRSY